MTQISTRAQRIMIWWSIVLLVMYGIGFMGFMRMFPLLPATLNAQQVAAIYAANATGIRVGAVICSWSGAFLAPIAIVIAVQLARLERGFPIWATLAGVNGCLAAIFLALPPIMWGTAAFNPGRPPEITLLMHELANLTLVTTPQFGAFQSVAIAYVALTQKVDPHAPFPRWFGYFTLWVMLTFEVGAFGFLPKTGPFAWNGLFVLWLPFGAFGTWFWVMAYLLFRAIARQSQMQTSPATSAPLAGRAAD